MVQQQWWKAISPITVVILHPNLLVIQLAIGPEVLFHKNVQPLNNSHFMWTCIETTDDWRWHQFLWLSSKYSYRWQMWHKFEWSWSWSSSYRWQMWRPSEWSWQWRSRRCQHWSASWSTAGRPRNWKEKCSMKKTVFVYKAKTTNVITPYSAIQHQHLYMMPSPMRLPMKHPKTASQPQSPPSGASVFISENEMGDIFHEVAFLKACQAGCPFGIFQRLITSKLPNRDTFEWMEFEW